MRPLYKSLAHVTRGPNGHAGLWYDKLCDQWTSEEDKRGRTLKIDKLPWIKQLTSGPLGADSQLKEAVIRIHRLVDARGGKLAVLTTESRFVTGLGRSNPVENGFTWHPTLGVPYLPGSSIKGLVRAWAQDIGSDRAMVDRLFGRERDADRDLTSGELIFLDAIPLRPVHLEADVMTPHFASWTPKKPPGDWSSPNPVPFLVVAAKTPFAFSILARHGAPPDIAFEWLRDALSNAGAGAKTAVGYGRFELDDKATQLQLRQLEAERAAAEEARQRAELERSPEGRWLLQLRPMKEKAVLDLVRLHVDAPPADPAERQAFARAVRQLPYFERWLVGKTVDQSFRIGPDKLKPRAKAIVADAE